MPPCALRSAAAAVPCNQHREPVVDRVELSRRAQSEKTTAEQAGAMKPQPTVVITGASAGVGRATAHAFARLGARIGLIAREPQALEDTAEELRQRGGQALALPADIADAAAVA